jgi:hypothetical protein
MTEAETLEIINHLLNRAGNQLGVTLNHPSALEPDGWSNWTWELEPQGGGQVLCIKHWWDQYDFDREDMPVRLPPILSEVEQEAFVKAALEKIALLKRRSSSLTSENKGQRAKGA